MARRSSGNRDGDEGRRAQLEGALGRRCWLLGTDISLWEEAGAVTGNQSESGQWHVRPDLQRLNNGLCLH